MCLALRAVAHAGHAAAVVGSALPNTSSNTYQADALTLVATTLQSSLAVEGELLENVLAAYGTDGDYLLLAPPYELVGEHENRESAKALGALLGLWPRVWKRKGCRQQVWEV